MEEVKEDGGGEPAERRQSRQNSNQTPSTHQPQQTSWLQTLRTLRPGWYSFAPVGVVWSICRVEGTPSASLLPVDVCWRLLAVCLLWMALGGCVHALKCCLRPRRGGFQGERPVRMQQEVVTENRNNHYLWTSQLGSRDHHVPPALALADSLLLCVLQEPLSDPSMPHIKALLSRLESVCHTLEKADIGWDATLERPGRDCTLIDKVKVIHTYLQQRSRSLCRLVQVQEDFEARVKDMLEGLQGLWAQLEELHTGVTLTKEGGGGRGDLASAGTHAETLFTVLGRYRNRLQSCQALQEESTQLLQELTWRNAKLSNSGSGGSESVWPELLLQANMEQFDQLQESFINLEQQTTTFQAHLEGLGIRNREGHTGTGQVDHADGARSRSVSPQTSLHLQNGGTTDERDSNPTSASTSVSSMEIDTDTDRDRDSPLSLRERSALQFSSTIQRLRKSGMRK
uniref:uncharacterized protein si:ch211-151h10.2 n=1 Tax=Gasterosteus aculeatus aculeatus TaxID=481459 RepID=UPI001A99D4FF|nr:uncharacterized protein si:ch211-151h10.2 [Gasterosteus aculeatus aculeatus]